MAAYFYILQLRSGAYYCGVTENLNLRYEEHVNGRGCRTTIIDPPVALLYSEILPTTAAARKREAQVKKWTRAKKEALISGDKERLTALAKSREHLENRRGI